MPPSPEPAWNRQPAVFFVWEKKLLYVGETTQEPAVRRRIPHHLADGEAVRRSPGGDRARTTVTSSSPATAHP